MATDTIYLRVDPKLKSQLKREAHRREITLQALIIQTLTHVLATEKEISSPSPTNLLTS